MYSASILAESKDIEISCNSETPKVQIYGFVPATGTEFNLKVDIDGNVKQYVHGCADTHCAYTAHQGDLFVVNAIDKKVFTIAFGDTGVFYAIPATIKYKKDTKGYDAEYKAVYYGVDPRSMELPKNFVETPIELTCTNSTHEFEKI